MTRRQFEPSQEKVTLNPKFFKITRKNNDGTVENIEDITQSAVDEAVNAVMAWNGQTDIEVVSDLLDGFPVWWSDSNGEVIIQKKASHRD